MQSFTTNPPAPKSETRRLARARAREAAALKHYKAATARYYQAANLGSAEEFYKAKHEQRRALLKLKKAERATKNAFALLSFGREQVQESARNFNRRRKAECREYGGDCADGTRGERRRERRALTTPILFAGDRLPGETAAAARRREATVGCYLKVS